MDSNIKDMIKIPEGLDNAILKGFERGKAENKSKKSKVIFKRSAIAAGIIVCGTTMFGIINPDIVSAIPIVGNVFNYFNDGIYKQSADKYEELGQLINTSVVDNDVTVTLNKVVVDDNLFIASMIIQSDKFLGFDELRSPQDFIYPDFEVWIDGELLSSQWSNVTVIDERTAAVVLEGDISRIELNDEVKINLSMKYVSRGNNVLARGDWPFDIKATKGADSKVYNIGQDLTLNDTKVTFEKLVSSDLVNRLYLTGKFSDYSKFSDKNFSINDNDFIIKDNKGNILSKVVSSGVTDSSGNFEFAVDILNDLQDVEYIEIFKSEGNSPIIKEIDGWGYNLLKSSSSDEEHSNRVNETISRKPTKEELDDGYALDNVTYNINIDRNTAFQSIDDLIGKEIAVNNTDKVIVKDIIVKDDYTEVVMKIDGIYDYTLLGSLVLFDEDMNDAGAFEGSVTVLNDIKEKIVTVKITKIDPSKKYTIAVPVTNDLVMDESSKVTIILNK